MKRLQATMERRLRELPQHLLSDLLAERLAEHGLDLSDVERKSFAKRILANSGRYTHRHWKPGDHRHIKLELTPGDLERLEAKADKFAERIPDLIEKVTDKTSATMLAALRKRWPKQSRVERREMDGFRAQLYGRWKHGLELLRMMRTISYELGADINDELSGPTKSVIFGATANRLR